MLAIQPLLPESAGDIVDMVKGDDVEYRRYFSGLPDDPEGLADSIRDARRDAFWGIWKSRAELSGVVMLRGVDAGFAAPAFGVYVRSADAGCGLARLAMQHAISHCRLQSIPEIMLTVDEGNTRARQLYERMGFVKTGEQSPKGQPIYRRRLDV